MAKEKYPERNDLGRPTKYKPEFDDIAEEILAEGGSIVSVAAALDTVRETIYMWGGLGEYARTCPTDVIKTFSDALKRGLEKSETYWENIGHRASNGYIKNFSAAAWVFSMKNRFKWADRVEQTINSNIELKSVKDMTDEELERIVDEDVS